MKNSTKSNMYERTLEGTWGLFGDYLKGAREALLCVVSASPLSQRATEALQSSFAQLGYGKAACTFVALRGNGLVDGTPEGGMPGGNMPVLGEKEVSAVIEGLDPLLLVIADKTACEACSKAYRQKIPLDQRSRVLGREVRAFSSFEAMLDDPQAKKAAWMLLKSLPKFDA